ncbi:NERD domain-containing protein [Piscibacillus salipiscarius]|uniref:NERD domain-containing protein n=1 Tax=Piscibacillus salipiscarius TaxID=299480 RepID=A0ABW5QAW1_9BACI|nr:NERD domain-containing protein [Piscibacillus salipiscarius]
MPNKEGCTTQIDHVVTSPYGIFVIETKHYQGWIFGKEHQRYWTQTIYKRKEKLYNPIWQNYGHVQSLKQFLSKEDMNYLYSIIVFTQDSTLKFKDDFKSARVIQIPQLVGAISERKLPRIGRTELAEINHALEGLIIHDRKEKRQVMKKHVADIKTKQKVKVFKEKEQIKQNLCPKCGGKLSQKKGKYGSFYGCSNYPKCRYTGKVS